MILSHFLGFTISPTRIGSQEERLLPAGMCYLGSGEGKNDGIGGVL